jgi:hypothetical protein
LNPARILFKIQASMTQQQDTNLCCLLRIIIYICKRSLCVSNLRFTQNSILRLSVVDTDNEMLWLRDSTENAAIILNEESAIFEPEKSYIVIQVIKKILHKLYLTFSH